MFDYFTSKYACWLSGWLIIWLINSLLNYPDIINNEPPSCTHLRTYGVQIDELFPKGLVLFIPFRCPRTPSHHLGVHEAQGVLKHYVKVKGVFRVWHSCRCSPDRDFSLGSVRTARSASNCQSHLESAPGTHYWWVAGSDVESKACSWFSRLSGDGDQTHGLMLTGPTP
jgi:hypothetical protein